jgi:SSS family solute:Na+ symporter
LTGNLTGDIGLLFLLPGNTENNLKLRRTDMNVGLQILAVVRGQFHLVDTLILFAYFAVLIVLGVVTSRKIKTSEGFMLAGRKIPGWAAGLSVMCAYTSSISYIATPGKAFDTNWNPVIFAYGMIPVALFVTAFIIPYYRKINVISVYQFLERRLGNWGRVYASISFMLYMIGRIAVILYLACLLLGSFIQVSKGSMFNLDPDTLNIVMLILIVGIITIAYTLLGGMEAVIWADVLQAVIMLSGIIFAAGYLTYQICSGPEPAVAAAWESGKFSWMSHTGAPEYSLFKRTILVMIIYAVSENLRNLMADQNYVQKFASCSTEKEAKRSVWVATVIYVIMTTIFIYIGTALWAYYHGTGKLQAAGITKGDEVFPFYIAHELVVGLRGLLIAAIMAAAISTIATAFNCSATIWLEDFHKKFINPDLNDKQSVLLLRLVTIIWGFLGIAFAVWMIKAKSALDVWWTMSGIFGGGILGLFLLSLLRVKLRLWQGVVSILVSILIIAWGVLIREGSIIEGTAVFNLLTDSMKIPLCRLETIIVGATGTVGLLVVGLLFGLTNRKEEIPA